MPGNSLSNTTQEPVLKLTMTHFPDADFLRDPFVGHVLPFLLDNPVDLAHFGGVSKACLEMLNENPKLIEALFKRYGLPIPKKPLFSDFVKAFNQTQFSSQCLIPRNSVLETTSVLDDLLNKEMHGAMMKLLAAVVARDSAKIKMILETIQRKYYEVKKIDDEDKIKRRQERLEQQRSALLFYPGSFALTSCLALLEIEIIHSGVKLIPLSMLQDVKAETVLSELYLLSEKTPKDRVKYRQFTNLTRDELGACLFAALELQDDSGLEILLKLLDQWTKLNPIVRERDEPDLLEDSTLALIDTLRSPDQSHRPLLSHAATLRYKNGVRLLIQYGASLKVIDEDPYREETPLCFACSGENESLVQLLIDAGADIRALNSLHTRTTPLHVAARNADHPNILKILISKGADITALDNEGCTPLHCSASYFQPRSTDDPAYENPNTLLLIKAAEEQGKDHKSFVNQVNSDGKNVLHIAVKYAALGIIPTLLREGVDLWQPDNRGYSPLFYLSTYDPYYTYHFLEQLQEVFHCDIADFLIRNVDNQGRTFLYHAITWGKKPEKIITTLCEFLSPQEFQQFLHVRDQTGVTALHQILIDILPWRNSIRRQNVLDTFSGKIFSKLIQADSEGNTIVHELAESGDESSLDKLNNIVMGYHQRSENISFSSCQNQKGDTPLHVAVNHGHDKFALRWIETFNDLLMLGEFQTGHTPLHLAIEKKNFVIVAALLKVAEKKPELLTVKNKAGYTPLEYLNFLGPDHFESTEAFSKMQACFSEYEKRKMAIVRADERRAQYFEYHRNLEQAAVNINPKIQQLDVITSQLDEHIQDLENRCFKISNTREVITDIKEIREDLGKLIGAWRSGSCKRSGYGDDISSAFVELACSSQKILQKFQDANRWKAYDQHRGLRLILLNIAILMAGLIIFSLGALAIRKCMTHASSFFINPNSPTQTSRKMHGVENALKEIKQMAEAEVRPSTVASPS